MDKSDWGFYKFGEKGENWPKNDKGEFEKPVFFEHVSGTQLDMDLAVNILTAYSIPFICDYPNNGEFGKLILGFSGTGMDIYVPESMLDDARNILSGDIEPEI